MTEIFPRALSSPSFSTQNKRLNSTLTNISCNKINSKKIHNKMSKVLSTVTKVLSTVTKRMMKRMTLTIRIHPYSLWM